MRYCVLICCCLLTALPQAVYAEDDAFAGAFERYLELTHAEETFLVGLQAGLAMGFDPKVNPGLASIPEQQLTRLVERMSALMEERFSFARIKPHVKSMMAEQFTADELGRLNELLADPIMAKYLRQQINGIPVMTKLSSQMVVELQPDIMALTMEVLRGE